MIDIYPFPNQPWFFTGLHYKSFENTVGKREIARNEQFLFFPQCLLSFWRTSDGNNLFSFPLAQRCNNMHRRLAITLVYIALHGYVLI